MGFDYPSANLPSALVEPLPPVFLLAILLQPSLSGWTSGVVAPLDDPSGFRAQMDFFVSDAQPWDQMDPAIPKYEPRPSGILLFRPSLEELQAHALSSH